MSTNGKLPWRSGQTSLLALDWAKAFDSVHVGRLIQCLQRFGVSGVTLKAISSLMRDRKFFVEDGGCKSTLRQQRSGISQGCTLSPLLFITVMSAVMHDAVAMLSPPARAAYDRGDLADVVFADDTLLVGANSKFVTEFIRVVAAAGRAIGLELHEDKFQLLQVRCHADVLNASSDKITASPSMCYLGANLAADGRVGSELSRRIGAAKGDFRSLCQVWRHSALTTAHKLKVFRTLVESRLLYALCTGCYTKAELRRLDGFQAKCLRTILRILPSHLSRISNAAVRERAGWKCASRLLLARQLFFLGKVIRSTPDSLLSAVSFIPGTLQPATSRFIRRVGRPRKEWISEVLPHAFLLAGGEANLRTAVQNQLQWKLTVRASV